MSNEWCFTIDPQPKPRMTRQDKWKPRAIALRYWAYKDQLNLMAKLKKFVLPHEGMAIVFVMPIPKSWTKKKQEEMNAQPHRQTPDLDNLIKGFWDALADEDKHLWKVSAIKRWGKEGMIVVQEI